MIGSTLKRYLCLTGILILSGCGGQLGREIVDENFAGPLQFREVAEESGLVFQHFIGASGQYYLPEIMGSGVALLDYDLDGDLDVYLLQGTMLDKTIKPEMAQFTFGSEPGNRLFENRILPEGELLFRDVTAKSGLGLEGYFMGVAVGDYDADGDPDLYLTSLGPMYCSVMKEMQSSSRFGVPRTLDGVLLLPFWITMPTGTSTCFLRIMLISMSAITRNVFHP